MTAPLPTSPADEPTGEQLARTIHRNQANGLLRCVNCGHAVGHPHDVLCYAYAQARSHLRHLTDGNWHDACTWCMRRRLLGGTGLEPTPKVPNADPAAPVGGGHG